MRDPLDIRSWSTETRLLVWLSTSVASYYIVALVLDRIGLEPAWPLGRINQFVAMALITWYLADVLFPRRSIYAAFGMVEGTLKHSLRFWRRVALLTCAVIGLGSALVMFLPGAEPSNPINAQNAAPLAVLAGAFLTSFGWMYTRFEQD